MKNINNIFAALDQSIPTAKTELEYTNNFTLLIAVVLSARATDKGVNKATKALFAKYDTPEAFILLGEEGLREYIKTIGLYQTKAKNIIALSKILVEKHSSQVPNTLEDLIALPGVGRKTANVVLNCAFNQATIPVDTHVERVSRRLGIAKSKNVHKIEQELLRNIPKKWALKAHHLLVLHGRYVCLARKPKCQECVLNQWCEAFKSGKF